jgi:hypothetical protein
MRVWAFFVPGFRRRQIDKSNVPTKKSEKYFLARIPSKHAGSEVFDSSASRRQIDKSPRGA